MKHFLIFSCILTLGCFACNRISAQTPQGQRIAPRVSYCVRGKVVNEKGRPVKGLEILLLHSSIEATEDYFPETENVLQLTATTRDTTNRKGLFECHLEDLINLEERLLIRDIDGKKHKEYQTKIEVVKFDANEIQNCGGHIEKQISVVVERIH